jgi:hypothetical protein
MRRSKSAPWRIHVWRLVGGQRSLSEKSLSGSADAFAIVVETVGFGVEGDGKVAAQVADEVVERLRRVDPEELDFAL